MAELQHEVCVYCGNRYRDVCMDKCLPEAKYRHLEPEVTEFWDKPRLPGYREFMEWPANAKLAYLYLIAFYQEMERCPSN